MLFSYAMPLLCFQLERNFLVFFKVSLLILFSQINCSFLQYLPLVHASVLSSKHKFRRKGLDKMRTQRTTHWTMKRLLYNYKTKRLLTPIGLFNYSMTLKRRKKLSQQRLNSELNTFVDTMYK